MEIIESPLTKKNYCTNIVPSFSLFIYENKEGNMNFNKIFTSDVDFLNKFKKKYNLSNILIWLKNITLSDASIYLLH